MEADSIFSNDLDEYITNDGVEKKKKKGKCIHNKSRCRECGKGFCKHGIYVVNVILIIIL